MAQPMPVTRQIYWPALFPQCVALLLLGAGVQVILPQMMFATKLFAAAVIYLVICRSLRRLLVHDHALGMAAYRAGDFQEAIEHFQASRDFFSSHRRLDAWRAFIFGVACRNPYRVIALGNMAYCYGQLGERAKAIALCEEALREQPDYTLVRHLLNLLQAGAAPAAVNPNQTKPDETKPAPT